MTQKSKTATVWNAIADVFATKYVYIYNMGAPRGAGHIELQPEILNSSNSVLY